MFLAFFIEFDSTDFEGKIDNGTEISLASVPFLVSIRKDNNHICVGNFISYTHVLTVAKCIYKIKKTGKNKNIKRYRVWAGMFNRTVNHLVLKIRDLYFPDEFNSSVPSTVGNIGLLLVRKRTKSPKLNVFQT